MKHIENIVPNSDQFNELIDMVEMKTTYLLWYSIILTGLILGILLSMVVK